MVVIRDDKYFILLSIIILSYYTGDFSVSVQEFKVLVMAILLVRVSPSVISYRAIPATNLDIRGICSRLKT